MENTGICNESDNNEEETLRRGPWTKEEDLQLLNHVSINGDSRWEAIAKASGLKRTGRSCRLRWLNYLRPDLKKCKITSAEEQLIIKLHKQMGNRWSRIATYLPGRTDNDIKNYFRCHMRKKVKHKIDENYGNLYDNITHDSDRISFQNESSSHISEEQISVFEYKENDLKATTNSELCKVSMGNMYEDGASMCKSNEYNLSDFVDSENICVSLNCHCKVCVDYLDELWNTNTSWDMECMGVCDLNFHFEE